MKLTINLQVEVSTDKPIEIVKDALKRGVYMGLDSPASNVAPPKDIKVNFLDDLKDVRISISKMLLEKSSTISNDYYLWSTWMGCISSALYLETLFPDEIGECGKSVYANLGNFRYVESRGDLLKWCSDTYDPYHPLRNSVETLDSIEEVREYLTNKSAEVGHHIGIHNLARLML